MNTKDENIRIGSLFNLIGNYRKLFFSICIAALLTGIGVLIFVPRQYKAIATLQLVNDKSDLFSDMKMLRASSGLTSMIGSVAKKINVDDEIAILKSNEIMGGSIRDLGLQVSYKMFDGVQKKELFNNSPVLIGCSPEFLSGLKKEKDAVIKVKNGKASLKINTGWFSSPSTEYKELPASFETEWGTFRLEKNTTAFVSSENYTVYITLIPFAKLFRDYTKDLEIETVDPLSNIIGIELDDENTDRSEQLINTLIARYNDYSLNVKIKENNQTITFIKERIEEVGKELSEYEYQIEQYKKKNRFTDIENDSRVQIALSEEYKVKEADLQIQLQLIRYVYDFLNNPSNNDNVIPAIMQGKDKEPLLSNQIVEYNRLVSEQIRLKRVSKETNPALQYVTELKEKQRANLTETIKTAIQSIELSQNELSKTSTGYKNRIAKLPTNEREFIEMKRFQTINEKLLVYLLEKMEELTLSSNPTSIPGRVVDEPYQSFKHVFPRGSIVLSIALIVGIILGLSTIALYEYVFRRTINRRIIEEQSSLRIYHSSGSSPNEFRARVNASGYIKVIQLFSFDKKENAEGVIREIITAFKKGGENVCVIEIKSDSDLTSLMTEMDRLKKEHDYLFIINQPISESDEALDVGQLTDLSLAVCNENITSKKTLALYDRWESTNLFNDLRVVLA